MIEEYLGLLRDDDRSVARTQIRRLLTAAVERGLAENAALGQPREPLTARRQIETDYPAEIRELVAMAVEMHPSWRGIHGSLLPWLRWARTEHIDPVRATSSDVARYLRESGIEDPTYWSGLPALRAFFDVAIAARRRVSHPLPRAGTPAITRSDDPLAKLVSKVIRSYRRSARASALSYLTMAINEIRAAGAEPLDISLVEFERILPARLRNKVWRPYGRLLETAGAAVGERGAGLRTAISTRTSGGRRHLTARWREFAHAAGFEPGEVPAIRREQFLARLVAEGFGGDVRSLRGVIGAFEHEARLAGRRPDVPQRIERLETRLAVLGVPHEQIGQLVEAIHGKHKPSVWRWPESVAWRYLDWCAEHSVAPQYPREADLERFQAERGDRSLRLSPVRRLVRHWAELDQQERASRLVGLSGEAVPAKR